MKQSMVKYSHKLVIHSEFIRSYLVENPILVKLVDLRKRLMSYMQTMGLTEILESTKKHFQRNSEKEFGDILQFEDLMDNKKLLVLPKNLSKAQLAKEVLKLSEKLESKNSQSKKFSKLAFTYVM